MTVIITGGAGFIGRHLVRALHSRGDRVVVVDDLRSGSATGIPDGVGLIVADVLDLHADDLADDTRVVVHLAAVASVEQSWREPESVERCNLGTTLRVIEWARRVPGMRVIFASSAAVYGVPRSLPVTEHATTLPLSPYGLHKLAGETYLRLFAPQVGMSAVALRFFNVYGPGQSDRSDYAGVVATFAKRVLAGQPVTIHGGGQQTRDFVCVDDVVSSILRAIDLALPSGTYREINVGSGRSVSVCELLDAIERVAGKAVPRNPGPGRQGDVPHSRADLSLAATELGYRPRVTLEDGLRSYLEWLTSPAGQAA